MGLSSLQSRSDVLLQKLEVLCEAIEEVLARENKGGESKKPASEQFALPTRTFELDHVIPETFTDTENSPTRFRFLRRSA